ncbi:MAG: hypothetical protein PF508_02815 [Spirochaeta sp.]|jgi:hypothetical protein|nr:hypothetical protein [Spirochaeta sp.]
MIFRLRFRFVPFLVLLLYAVASPGAQALDLTPWVLVVPPANTTGNPSLDPVGDTVAETIEITLRQLGDFELRELPAERIPAGVIAGEGFAISAAVWDRGADAVDASETLLADSLFATFDVADELALIFLTTFSGQRIAFGSVLAENTGWAEGSYRILVDGRQVVVDESRVQNVLIGTREITVVANNGADPGAVVLRREVTITEDEPTSISFAIVEPVEAEPVAADEPTVTTEERDDQAVAEEPQPEPEEPEIPLWPWTRETRRSPGRRPILTVGFSTRLANLPDTDNALGADGNALFGGFGLLFLAEFEERFQGGISVLFEGTFDEDQSPEDVQPGYIRGDELGQVQLYAGYRLLTGHAGAFSADLSGGGILGLAGVTVTYREESEVAFGEVGNLYGLAGIQLFGRLHWRRYHLQMSVDLIGYQGVPGSVDEDISNGLPESTLPDNGLAVGVDLGVGVSFGGRPKR